jgi:hypothetical protein
MGGKVLVGKPLPVLHFSHKLHMTWHGMNAGCHGERLVTKYRSHGATKVSSTQECNMCVAGTEQYFYIHFGVSSFIG